MALKFFKTNGDIAKAAGLPPKINAHIIIQSKGKSTRTGPGFGYFKTVAFQAHLEKATAKFLKLPFSDYGLACENSLNRIKKEAVLNTMEQVASMITPTSSMPYLTYVDPTLKSVSQITFSMVNRELKATKPGEPNYEIKAFAESGKASGDYRKATVFDAKSMVPRKEGGTAFILDSTHYPLEDRVEFLSQVKSMLVNVRNFPLEGMLWARDRNDGGGTLMGMPRKDVDGLDPNNGNSYEYYLKEHKCAFSIGDYTKFKSNLLLLKPGERYILNGHFGWTKKILMERLSLPNDGSYRLIFIQDEPLASHIGKAVEAMSAGMPYFILQKDRLLKIEAGGTPEGSISGGGVSVLESKFTVSYENSKYVITGFDSPCFKWGG